MVDIRTENIEIYKRISYISMDYDRQRRIRDTFTKKQGNLRFLGFIFTAMICH